MAQKPSVLRKLTYIALIFLSVTLIAEFSLRWRFGLGNPVLITSDPACNFTLKPNQEVRRFFCRTHVNRYAMRSDEIAPSPAPGTLRLLFVGDSITYGTSRVDQANLFTELTGQKLGQQLHQRVETLNAATSAWAIDNELSYVRSRGIFQSNLVLLVLNSGDLSQPRARMEQVGDLLVQKKPAGALAELWTRSIKERLFGRHAAPKEDAGTTANLSDEAEIQANLNRLDEFAHIVEGQQGRLAVVYIPFWHDLATNNEPQRARLRGWAAARRVPLLDMTDTEAQHTAKEITLDGRTHLNAAGHQLIAEALVQQLRRGIFLR